MSRYEEAKQIYASCGVDTDAAIARLKEIPVSLHCWQGDDVIGFDHDGPLTGGIPDHRKLSGEGQDAGGADRRYGEGHEPDAGQEEDQCPCVLCRF